MEKKIMIERINNRMNTCFNEFSYAKDTKIYNAYTLLLNWWFEAIEKEERCNNWIESIYNASRIDALDFFSATSFAVAQICSGRKLFNFRNYKKLYKEYITVDGINIQTHDKMLMVLSIQLIEYIFKCHNEFKGFSTFSKSEELPKTGSETIIFAL